MTSMSTARVAPAEDLLRSVFASVDVREAGVLGLAAALGLCALVGCVDPSLAADQGPHFHPVAADLNSIADQVRGK